MSNQKHITAFPPTNHNRAPVPDHREQANKDLYEALSVAGAQRWKDGTATAYIDAKTGKDIRISLDSPSVSAMIVRTTAGNRFLMTTSHLATSPRRAEEAGSSWVVTKLPERDNRTGEYVKKAGEKTWYGSGPIHEDTDYPEATIGSPVWGAPAGDRSNVESITFPADDIVANFGLDYAPAHSSTDPVMNAFHNRIVAAPNNGRTNPFEANAQIADQTTARALGKLAAYNVGL